MFHTDTQLSYVPAGCSTNWLTDEDAHFLVSSARSGSLPYFELHNISVFWFVLFIWNLFDSVPKNNLRCFKYKLDYLQEEEEATAGEATGGGLIPDGDDI